MSPCILRLGMVRTTELNNKALLVLAMWQSECYDDDYATRNTNICALDRLIIFRACFTYPLFSFADDIATTPSIWKQGYMMHGSLLCTNVFFILWFTIIIFFLSCVHTTQRQIDG